MSNASEKVFVPKGVESGTLLIMRGKGHELGNGKFGDLLLTVNVRPHPYFK